MATTKRIGPTDAVIDRASLRLGATLLVTGQLLYILVTQFHAGGQANDHREIFAIYAGDQLWTAVHVAQFVCAAILLAGLVALAFAMDIRATGARWASRFGAASAVVALALYAVLQAIDGIGNKQVDAAWASAGASEQVARFAAAESVRWLEWGARSYFDYALGIALLLVAVAIVRTAGVLRAIGYLMGLSGLTYLVQGWVVGAQGFSETHTILILLAWAFSIAWMIWLVIVAWRSITEPKSTGTPPAVPQA